MAGQSTNESLQNLHRLARERSDAGRKALVDAVSDLFFDDQHVLSDREKALMTDILRQIIHDVEMSVRVNLAERLAETKNAPHELILLLANDEIEVAHPILLESDLLHDTDLIEIIHHRTLEHQLSIAMRKSINEDVTDALVEEGNEDVVKTMLENSSARISKGTMEYLVHESKRVDSYQNPLLSRPDLAPELAKRMYWWVSAALRQHIVEHYEVDLTEIDETIETAVKDVIRETKEEEKKEAPIAVVLAERLAESEAITPKLLVQVLRQGEIPLFEALFAKMTGLDVPLVRQILFEPGGEALAMACKAAEIDKSNFASLFMLSRKAWSGEEAISPIELTRVLNLFDRVQTDMATKLLKQWRRDPEFLGAMSALERKSTKD